MKRPPIFLSITYPEREGKLGLPNLNMYGSYTKSVPFEKDHDLFREGRPQNMLIN
jgi:hypothetical protein